ncbi:MAG: M1 family metallopeptidase [Acidobacteria bacterium]|nr:M1 family metallopeptidase [Acidobacteriota bacterium]
MRKIDSLLLALLLFAAPASAQRLSRNVTPEHYTLWFAPDLESATFRGRESIRVQLRTSARAITLHAAEIEFGEVTIEAAGGTQAARVTLDAKAETATLAVPHQIPAGAATIRLTYRGTLNDKLRGFYLSRANGRKYAVTQMEPTDARRAFPSFDEPVYKATFDVSLMIDLGDTAISNGAQLSDTPGPEPGKHTLTFATTPTMSTYLVAMIVGDFVCRTGASGGTPIRVCSTPDKRELTLFAIEAAEQQLAFYNAFFGVPYAFGKLDIIAIPDFAAGAMENSGALTFRERLLLVDPQRSSLGARKRVASIVSHEIAHQWFGNLVTMKWWDDIWLNEGFATWLASKPLTQWRPEWKVELDDAADTQSALGLDALPTTRPIRLDVHAPEQINEAFDAIAYEKTAGVLRMLEAFVGPEPFRKGVASYLTKYSYANAAGEDFWSEMTRVTGRPIDRIMKGYVEQSGVPVVSVRTRCTGTNTEITLSQQRFVATPVGDVPPAQTWTTPVCFKANDGPVRCEVLERPRQTVSAPGCANVFANADGRGYYLTEYSPEAVGALARDAGGLKSVERLSLLGDEWWMVRGGRHDIGVYLDLATGFAGDEAAAITEAIATRLATIGEYVVAPDRKTRYEAWVRARFGPALNALGLPGGLPEGEERHSRRAELLTLVGVTGNDTGIQRRGLELGVRYIASPASLHPTLVPAVLRMAAMAGNAVLYDLYLLQLERLGSQPEEYSRFFSALPWFRDPALVQRTLALALSSDVRTQDAGTLIAGLLARPWSRDAAWTFVKTEWQTLVQKLGTIQGIPTIVGALGNFCAPEAAADVRQFFAKHPVPSAERGLQQSLERIDNCAALVSRQSPALTAWLQSANP